MTPSQPDLLQTPFSQPPRPNPDPTLQQAEQTLWALRSQELAVREFGPEAYDNRSRALLASLEKPEEPRQLGNGLETADLVLKNGIRVHAVVDKNPTSLKTVPYSPEMEHALPWQQPPQTGQGS